MTDKLALQKISGAFFRTILKENESVEEVLSVLTEDLLPERHDKILLRVIKEHYESGRPIDEISISASINGESRIFPYGSPAAYIEGIRFEEPTAHEKEKSPGRFKTWALILQQAKVDGLVKDAAKKLVDEPSNDFARKSIIEAFNAEAEQPITAKSLTELAEQEIDASKTLLGDRYLCVEGGMLLVGQSGIGKSSASAQQDADWARGRPSFGIKPSRPLKILCIQAENDEGDMIEFSKGVLNGLNFSEADREMVRKNTMYISHKSSVGPEFISFLEKCLRQFRPDIVRIDPFTAYLGDDDKETKAVQLFLRNMINPLLEKYQAAVIVNCHTPKVTNRDTTHWTAHDWMYSVAGAAGIVNWARAILVIDACKDDRHTFKFIAAKRGSRIGWADGAGDPTTEAYFRHSRHPGLILWEPADDVTIAQANLSKNKSKEDIFTLVPLDRPIEKTALISKAQTFGIGINKAKGWIAELLDEGRLFNHFIKRSGTRDMVEVSRFQQGGK